MKLEINYTLQAGKNAETKYLERNRYKSKLLGAKKAILITNRKIQLQEKNIQTKEDAKPILSKRIIRKKEWFHNFRWCITSSGFLVLAGKDTKNNEFLIKKHLEKNDLYFHADVHGAPHVILKNNDFKEILDVDKEEAACFALIFSSAWKNKYFSAEVYSVKPDQVSKTANTGESLSTGSFVIRGKREYYKKLNLKLKLVNDKLKGMYSAPVLLTSKPTKDLVYIVPGDTKKSDASKKIKEYFAKKNINLLQDEIDSILPPGNCEVII
jgi:predicted ribosome quality control (RQC) complex YloA/Tae2 family protein